MKSLSDWLQEYSLSHRHPTNILIHKICVPLIAITVLGLLWRIPTPQVFSVLPFCNWSTLFAFFVLFFYATLNTKLMVAMAVILAFVFPFVHYTSLHSSSFWAHSGVFLIAWILQFIGHRIEGKRPSFLQDLAFLLIGPLWALNHLLKIVPLSQTEI